MSKFFVGLVISGLILFTQSAWSQEKWIKDQKGCLIANLAPSEGETVQWTGACKDNFADGHGTLTWFTDGVKMEVFEGTMVGGYAEGKGKLARRNGKYVGEWHKSQQHGKGRYDNEDGSWYQGEWKEGQPHGKGQMLLPNGRLLKGYWNEGEFEEAGAMPGRT